jgi:hypothetical protein
MWGSISLMWLKCWNLIPTLLFYRIKMRYCFVCKSAAEKLFVFPKDESRLLRWMRRLNLRIRPSRSDLICYTHFEPSDIIRTANGYHKLRPDAVPVLSHHVTLDHPYSRDQKDPFSDTLSLLMMLSPFIVCLLPLLILVVYSINELSSHSGKLFDKIRKL